MTEHDLQASIFEWADWHMSARPELALMFAVPNGGHRHMSVARKLKAEGVKRGVPDICLPVARGGYHGLWIELKVGRNKPTPEQLLWHTRLAEAGHCVAVCKSFEDASGQILWYLSQGDPQA